MSISKGNAWRGLQEFILSWADHPPIQNAIALMYLKQWIEYKRIKYL